MQRFPSQANWHQEQSKVGMRGFELLLSYRGSLLVLRLPAVMLIQGGVCTKGRVAEDVGLENNPQEETFEQSKV